MKERRKVWSHLKGAPFSIRRFTSIPPMIEGEAYGAEMVERRVFPGRRSPTHTVYEKQTDLPPCPALKPHLVPDSEA